jgi:hypothetical protein
MLRGPKVTVAVAVAFVLLGAAAAAIYMRERSRRGPTPDEYRVYRVLLTRLTADNNRPPSAFALSSTTLRLGDPHAENWIPPELRRDRMTPPPHVVSLCGDLCGREYVRKNLVQWRFNPTAQVDVGFPIVGPPKEIPPEIPPKYRVVEVTRVGFNVWHTRAFLSYAANCNDYSPEHPVMCVELGEAYLEKKNGAWKVDHHEAVTF